MLVLTAIPGAVGADAGEIGKYVVGADPVTGRNEQIDLS
jgi:hypothetical protein